MNDSCKHRPLRACAPTRPGSFLPDVALARSNQAHSPQSTPSRPTSQRTGARYWMGAQSANELGRTSHDDQPLWPHEHLPSPEGLVAVNHYRTQHSSSARQSDRDGRRRAASRFNVISKHARLGRSRRIQRPSVGQLHDKRLHVSLRASSVAPAAEVFHQHYAARTMPPDGPVTRVILNLTRE